MNPASTTLLRRWTGVASALVALITILTSGWILFSPPVQPILPILTSVVGGRTLVQKVSQQGLEAGVGSGDRLVSIDGIPSLLVLQNRNRLDSERIDHLFEIQKFDGRVLQVRLDAASADFARQPLETILEVCLLITSLFYLVMGAMVWRSKWDRGEAWAFMLFCSIMAIELASLVQLQSTPWGVLRMICVLPFLGATTFHLFSSFPIEPAWVVRHRRIRAVPYVLAVLLSVVILLDQWVLAGFAEALADLSLFFGIGLSFASLGILISERHRARQAGVGDRTDVVIVAGVVGFLPAALILLAEIFLQTSFPPGIATLWVAFLPAVIGFAMLRRRSFELGLLARSSFAYGASTLAITGLFAFSITFVDQAAQRLGMTMRSAQIAFLFLAILTFNPLRERLQGLVDRIFDRDRSRYRLAVREISEAMVSMLSLREIGDRILAALTDTMGVERAMVLLFDEEERVLRPSVWRGDWEDQENATEIPSNHPIWRRLWMRREELCRADFDEEADLEKREVCWDIFDTLEVELLVPILFGVDLIGVIAVGRKITGERLAADDRQLLRTLANQSAIAMENAKAFDEIAQLNETLEARVEERTAELREIQTQLMQSEKLSSLGQLVAGVAHELNNPIGFVHANLQLLDEFIQKLLEAERSGADSEQLRDAIGKLLMRSREGTQRVKQIVQDLRTFSRMDQAELQEVDLHEEIDRTLTLMQPRLKGGIEIVREYGDLPRVRCYPGQLNQVFLNLLMNACDALGSTGTITVRTRRTKGGVRLQFQDDGPGIPPEVQGRLFDPFFTTKEVGKGTGLGLSLSHGIVERHHGQISILSTPGAGATFTVDLPLDATSGDELDSSFATGSG